MKLLCPKYKVIKDGKSDSRSVFRHSVHVCKILAIVQIGIIAILLVMSKSGYTSSMLISSEYYSSIDDCGKPSVPENFGDDSRWKLWSMYEVRWWICENVGKEFSHRFFEEEIEGFMLDKLTDDELVELNLKLGARKLFRFLVEGLKTKGGAFSEFFTMGFGGTQSSEDDAFFDEGPQDQISQEDFFFDASNETLDLDSPRLPIDHIWGKRFNDSLRIFCLLNAGKDSLKYIEIIYKFYGNQCYRFILVISLKDKDYEQFDDKWKNTMVWRLNLTYSGNMGEKMDMMFQYAYKHHYNDMDWLVKVEHGTYLSYRNLEGFLQFYNPKEHHYLGLTEWPRNKHHSPPFNAGCGYVISRATFEELGGVERTGRRPSAEDLYVSFLIARIGVYAENTMDGSFRQRFHAFPLAFIRNMKRFHERHPQHWFFRWRTPLMTPGMHIPHKYSILFGGHEDDVTERWEELKKEFGFNDKPLETYPLPPYPRHHFIEAHPDFPKEGQQ